MVNLFSKFYVLCSLGYKCVIHLHKYAVFIYVAILMKATPKCSHSNLEIFGLYFCTW